MRGVRFALSTLEAVRLSMLGWAGALARTGPAYCTNNRRRTVLIERGAPGHTEAYGLQGRKCDVVLVSVRGTDGLTFFLISRVRLTFFAWL